MKLHEITAACRTGEPIDQELLILAICAYDVLMAQITNDNMNQTQVKAEYFKAGDSEPAKYIGWNNHPDNPEFQSWYRSLVGKLPEDPCVACGVDIRDWCPILDGKCEKRIEYEKTCPYTIHEDVPGVEPHWFITGPGICPNGESPFPNFSAYPEAVKYCADHGYRFKTEYFTP
jgi:hypothetical protein